MSSNIVVYSVGDPEDAKNWSRSRKNLVVFETCLLSFAAGFGSPIFGPAEFQLISRFGVNEETADSGLAMFVLGFSFGPLFWGPMSEMLGRRLPYLIAWPLLVVFSIPSAFVDNVAVIIVFRFLAGCAAACAQNNGLGFIADMYGGTEARPRAIAIAWFTLAFCTGPMLAMIVGFFVVAHAGPELWVLRMYFFFVAALLPIAFVIPETHGPTILARRAKKLRDSGVSARAAHETDLTFRNVMRTHIVRPTEMMLREPLVYGSAAWVTLASSIGYLFFEVYPVVFFQQHNFSLQLTGLPFLSLLFGFVFAIFLVPVLTKRLVPAKFPTFLQPKEVTVDSPEAQLKIAVFGCVLMPVSLFWFAWTSGSETHWIAPTLSGMPFAISSMLILLSLNSYLSQVYTLYTNSAKACSSFLRALASAALVMASPKIVSSLGTKWGVSLFGFLSFGLLIIPFAFLRYGAALRAKSQFAKEAGAIVARMRAAAVKQAAIASPQAVERLALDKAEKTTGSEVSVNSVEPNCKGLEENLSALSGNKEEV